MVTPCYSWGMFVLFSVFWWLAALELMLWGVPSLKWRRVFAGVLATLLAPLSLLILVLEPSVLTVTLSLASMYRLINLLRLVKARINARHLGRATFQTSAWIIMTQVVVTLFGQLHPVANFVNGHLWAMLVYVDVAVAAVLLLSTIRHLWTTRAPKLTAHDIADAHLPTLTVAIPARNETNDLEACLSTLIASSYPKLEILVLDDCSQNKRTPEIIRSFAHAGVRFLQGAVPESNWLAKNQAYQQLCEAANGELVLFCGVDVRFAPDSLRLLVSALVRKRKSMISVIPRNLVPSLLTLRTSTLVQPMRYAWELALPRRIFNRPPVLSTCWIIRRDVIASAGGFAGVSRSIVPESYFARVSIVHDGYSFMQSSAAMAITSNKSLHEQRSTALRVQYPRVHRRIELVMFLTASELLCIIAPYALLVLGLLHDLPAAYTVAAATSVLLLTLLYASVVTLTYRTWLVRSLLTLPFASLLDIILLNYSMIRYEFFSVIWKERNVCIPVMHAADPLPESITKLRVL